MPLPRESKTWISCELKASCNRCLLLYRDESYLDINTRSRNPLSSQPLLHSMPLHVAYSCAVRDDFE
jgi:hypothetical protein